MERRITLCKGIFPAGVAIACLVTGLWVSSGDGSASKSQQGKETAMTRAIPKTTIPPLDAAAPAKTETASFALG